MKGVRLSQEVTLGQHRDVSSRCRTKKTDVQVDDVEELRGVFPSTSRE